MTKETQKAIGMWIQSDDVGRSSTYLCAVALGADPAKVELAYPHDSGDFGRCYRFMDMLDNETAKRVVDAVCDADAKWTLIFSRWDELGGWYEKEEHYRVLDALRQMEL